MGGGELFKLGPVLINRRNVGITEAQCNGLSRPATKYRAYYYITCLWLTYLWNYSLRVRHRRRGCTLQ